TMHRKAAATLETLHANERDAFIEEIAFHYEKAYELGVTTLRPVARARLRQAGVVAKRRYETEAAVDAFSRALALTEPEEMAVATEILLAREEVYAWRGQRAAQAKDLEQLAQLVGDLDRQRQAAVALRRAAFYAYIPDFDRAIPLIHEAIELAQVVDDGVLQAEAYRQLGNVRFRLREYDEALAAYDQALPLARAGGKSTTVTRTLNGMGMALDEQGNLADARVCYEEALQIQRQAGDLAGENTTLTNLGWQAFMQEETDRALAYYEQALALCRQIGHRVNEANGLANVGLLTFLHGDFEKARQNTRAAVRLYRETGNPRGEANALNNLALIACYQGQPERAEAFAQQSIGLARKWGGNGALSEGYLYLGHAHRLIGRLAEAQEAYERSLSARHNAHEGRMVEPLAGLAQVALLRGDLGPAVQYVEDILPALTGGDYAGLNEPFWVYEVCYRTLSQAGDGRAGAILKQAQTLLHTQAEKIKDEVRRNRFLEAFSIKAI
ncbi:MAG: tetratricopeptide repeat protein, partial [Candidatus Promineifilaceae bacterium]|nr:tetratricopeptide repeat protein [Candidatus Promineifilaceae bacterium]